MPVSRTIAIRTRASWSFGVLGSACLAATIVSIIRDRGKGPIAFAPYISVSVLLATTRTLCGIGVTGVLCMLSFACAAKKQPRWTYTAPSWAAYAIPTSVPVGRYGIGCRTVNEPDKVGPPSYSVYDIGKTGVPALTESEMALARRILHYVHSKTVRFRFVRYGYDLPNARIIIYDATQGPCFEGAAGYWIMNDADGNMYYQPGEAPDMIHAVPNGPTPGPWMR